MNLTEHIKTDNNYVCRVCLKISDGLKTASSYDKLQYYDLISEKRAILDDFYLCVYCAKLISKTTSFIKQCHLANILLSQKENVEDFKLVCNLVKSETYFCCVDDDSTQGPVDMKIEDWDQGFEDQNPDVSDDDKPLTMLKKDKLQDSEIFDLQENIYVKKRKKKKRKHELMESDHDQPSQMDIEEFAQKIKEEFDVSERNMLKDTKSKSIREGFTKRMVQETDEYLVIKLTNRQVLDEMKAKTVSEKYINAPFKCKMCAKGFNFEDVLKNHMEKHSPDNGILKCQLCHQYCPSAVSMRGHMKSHTTRYKCKVCGEIKMSRQHLLEHYSHLHFGDSRKYKCDDCGYGCYKRTVFQKHMKGHSPNPPIPCDKCGKMFKSIESLRVHVSRHSQKRRFICDQCPKTFIFASQLRDHISAHSPQEDLYCVECDTRFKSKNSLRIHFRKAVRHRDMTDPNTLRYACRFCDKRFISASSLSIHFVSVHGDAKRHACSKCARAYASADGLRAHIRRSHTVTAPKQYACEVCDRTFTTPTVLKRHTRVHTGERPYECNECGVKFSHPATKWTHIRLVHRKLPRRVGVSVNVCPSQTHVKFMNWCEREES